jgi:flavin reductase (DIM6/NTAB) family NADH-FMN oxidoreductase RutF
MPVWVIGTYDQEGKPNAMTAAWTGICCSKPPSVYVSLREATYTYHNLKERKAFTINIPSRQFVKKVDYLGIASGRDSDKFKVAELTPVKSEVVDAPYIEEFPLILECNLTRVVEIGLHTQFIGEIMDVKADPEILDEKGRPLIEKVNTFVTSPGIFTYHGIGDFLGHAFRIGKEIIPRNDSKI